MFAATYHPWNTPVRLPLMTAYHRPMPSGCAWVVFAAGATGGMGSGASFGSTRRRGDGAATTIYNVNQRIEERAKKKHAVESRNTRYQIIERGSDGGGFLVG
jgi:hypothetical protein